MSLFILGAHPLARDRALREVAAAPDGYRVRIEPEKRSDAQNDRMWALLTILAKQVIWHGQKLSKEEWKTMCTAALKKQRVLPGIDGGFVVMGESTRQMPVGEMADLMTFIEAFGAQQGVDFDSHYRSRESATA